MIARENADFSAFLPLQTAFNHTGTVRAAVDQIAEQYHSYIGIGMVGYVCFDRIDKCFKQVQAAMDVTHDIIALTIGDTWSGWCIFLAAQELVEIA